MPSDASHTLNEALEEPSAMALAHAAPPNRTGEVLGELVLMSPRPRARHARVATALGSMLWEAFDRGVGGPGGWVMLDEPELHLGSRPDVVVPDLCGWRRSRMPELPDVAAFTLAPDWVCEVLSPSTETIDRTLKMPIFAREGVSWVWLVRAEQQTLEVFALEQGAWHTVSVFQGSDPVRAQPFNDVEIPLGLLWAR